MKRVVFYEKYYKPGHREYIAQEIKKNLVTNKFFFTLHSDNDKKKNFLKSILELNQKNKIDHCHLLTLDDCIFDFLDHDLVDEFIRLKISLSATLFHFDMIQLKKNIINTVKNRFFLFTDSEQSIIFNLLKRGVLKKILIPDERYRNKLLYPVFNDKIGYLPDFIRFKPSFIKRDLALKALGAKSGEINFLMFGLMNRYKGLNFLAEIINRNLIKKSGNINIIIAGKQKKEIKLKSRNKKIKIIIYNRFIQNDFADILFSAADCIIMPFEKFFKFSSGTYALACAYGKPVITHDKGVLRWRVKRFDNGYLYKAGNARSFVGQLYKFIDDKKQAKNFSQKCLRYADLCSLKNYLKNLEKNIIDCL